MPITKKLMPSQYSKARQEAMKEIGVNLVAEEQKCKRRLKKMENKKLEKHERDIIAKEILDLLASKGITSPKQLKAILGEAYRTVHKEVCKEAKP